MELEFGKGGFFQLLQQLRRIHWGAELEVMTQGEFMAVSAIYHGQSAHPDQPGIYVSSLAEELMTSVSMVSKMLKTLEAKGWVLRTVDPKSRRNTFVSLTEEGRSLYADEQQRCLALNTRVMEKMGRENIERLLVDIQHLARLYAEELGTGAQS